MPNKNNVRFAVPISREELQAKVLRLIDEDWSNLREKVGKDFKVDVDFENFNSHPDTYSPDGMDAITGLVTLTTGLTFWGFWAGGDWEVPVYWVVYWDGKKLRAYIPTEGNPWNTTTKRAYGNDDEADIKNARKRYPQFDWSGREGVDGGDLGFEVDKILNDIVTRIKVTPT